MTKGLFVCFLLVGQLAFAQKDSVCSLPCANRTFTILIHEFVDTTLIPVHSIASLQGRITALNNAFAPICVSFSICSKRDINNYNFLQWDRDSMDAEAMGLYSELRVIDIFLVDDIVNPAGAEGYATLGGISQDNSKLVLKKGATSTTWIHEFGHFFGLFHPFETVNGIELANGSNCSTTGDLICDTPADPYPLGAGTNSNCEYIFSGRDPNNDYYLPDVENFMSYYDCACRFTPQQYVRMYNTYLIAPKTHW